MPSSWFSHTGLTLAEALDLEKTYQKRGKRVERLLEESQKTWCVNVYLQEYRHLPRSQMAACSLWNS